MTDAVSHKLLLTTKYGAYIRHQKEKKTVSHTRGGTIYSRFGKPDKRKKDMTHFSAPRRHIEYHDLMVFFFFMHFCGYPLAFIQRTKAKKIFEKKERFEAKSIEKIGPPLGENPSLNVVIWGVLIIRCSYVFSVPMSFHQEGMGAIRTFSLGSCHDSLGWV